MNLEYLFEIQAGLDAHIEDEHPRQDGEDRLAKKILALQVELGELANEWRGFKFWKINQQPVTLKEVFCTECGGTGTPFGIPEEAGIDCNKCEGAGSYYTNPLLEEYVDCLHFILGIGLEMNIPDEWVVDNIITELKEKKLSIEEQFISFNQHLKINIDPHDWFDILGLFYGLGEMLGFTWEQIEQSYLEKNRINHERQINGY